MNVGNERTHMHEERHTRRPRAADDAHSYYSRAKTTVDRIGARSRSIVTLRLSMATCLQLPPMTRPGFVILSGRRGAERPATTPLAEAEAE